MDRRRALGAEGEKIALQFLEKEGMKLLAKNYRCRLGELDLVFQEGSQIVFVEVRTKASLEYGTGFDSITYQKRTKLKSIAQQFLAYHNLSEADIRFDVVAIFKYASGLHKLEHLRGAF